MKKIIGTIFIIGLYVLLMWFQFQRSSNGAKITHAEMQQAIKNHAIVTYGEYNE